MRIGGWLCLVAGAVCLVAAVVLGIHAYQQGGEVSAYQHARPCPARAPAGASCLLKVDGAVAGVTSFQGGYEVSSVYALDVRTAAKTLHLTFASDSPMLDYAIDGDPAVVTVWRGVPVSVTTDGRSAVTIAVPRTEFWGDLRGAGKTAFVGAGFALAGWALHRKRKLALGQLQAKRAGLPPGHVRLRQPAVRARILGRRAMPFVPVLLTLGVIFGVILTSHDGPAARAYRDAPACAGETNLDSCTGDFTAVVNGVRTPVNGAGSFAVAFTTSDGVINTWATFDGIALAPTARADEAAETPLTIRVWRRSIVGAQLGGSWHWADGNPPGNTNPTILLAVSCGLLLLLVRIRIHRRPSVTVDQQGLVADDLGQAALAAGGTVLLALGFWPGAILVLGALAWLGMSVRRGRSAIMVA